MDIITRGEWGAVAPTKVVKTDLKNRTGFMVHYSGANKNQTVREIQRYHMEHNGWSDIGYNFLCDWHGRLYMGRGRDVIGAHAANNNTANIGVCFIGEDGDITDSAKQALRWLYEAMNHDTGRTLARRVHSDVNPTSCPGNDLRTWVHAGMLTAAPAWPKQFVVRPGDTLTDIANLCQRAWGSRATWRDLYNNNRSIIGPNPNILIPGQRLIVPF